MQNTVESFPYQLALRRETSKLSVLASCTVKVLELLLGFWKCGGFILIDMTASNNTACVTKYHNNLFPFKDEYLVIILD